MQHMTVDMYKENYNEGPPPIVVRAEKAHDLLSMSWRSRKARGVVHFKPERLRTRGTKGEVPVPVRRPENQEH